MENLTLYFNLPAEGGLVPLLLDDGHGDYNRSYEQYEKNDTDYADYSTDHRDNNYRNFEKKKRKRTDKEIVADILKRWD
ncbi:hypothetical protein [Phascolarctobacterium sp.]|uniref:hypothetical protein n=1 Tax=Phascolarctobacterium sp. TaxID=2049039 RepID=UPI0015AD088D|nr:hypothetical protein [uncultured Phascolarctobacterium sp.]